MFVSVFLCASTCVLIAISLVARYLVESNLSNKITLLNILPIIAISQCIDNETSAPYNRTQFRLGGPG